MGGGDGVGGRAGCGGNGGLPGVLAELEDAMVTMVACSAVWWKDWRRRGERLDGGWGRGRDAGSSPRRWW